MAISRYASDIDHWLAPGANPRLRYPEPGPLDRRAGYALLPELLPRVEQRGFDIVAQARVSARFDDAVASGLFPIYREKSRTGLTIFDRNGHALFAYAYPESALRDFETIPPLLTRVLLFIENRDLLDASRPYRNPAVEWDRLAVVAVQLGRRSLGEDGAVPGASTLATQLEKFRHSRGGATQTPREKLRQMASASVRAYRDGPATLEAQRRIVVDYLDGLPLAAIPGYGEVHGLLDGLRLWYGIEPHEIQLLREPIDAERLARAAYVYRASLSLLLATRRPAFYLGRAEGSEELARLSDVYSKLLVEAGAVPEPLARAAREISLARNNLAPPAQRATFVEQKATHAIRASLLDLLGVASLYQLDRLDLNVATPIDGDAQVSVAQQLRALDDSDRRAAAGLNGARLLPAEALLPVTYSLLLCEATPAGNYVRVQTDTFEGPRDANRHTQLELGSTAKLRTLVSYLEIVEALHERLGTASPDVLDAYLRDFDDPLTRWTGGLIQQEPGMPLDDVLARALQRRYSASPHERFFTAGGLHYFANFDDTFDAGSPTVQEAFSHSINLVFIRLMRDVVRYHERRLPFAREILADVGHPRRAEYLARFADEEGATFVRRFFRKHSGLTNADSIAALLGGRSRSPLRVARVYFAVNPEASTEDLAAFLAQHSELGVAQPEKDLAALRRRATSGARSLMDLAYLAGAHPLELWVVRYLAGNPAASLAQALADGAQARQEAYDWLFRTRRKSMQDERIRTLLEADVFAKIQADWARLGYPFRSLVPSYATALGSSGDTPEALATLVGILVNDGLRRPFIYVDTLRFAEGTPFETLLGRTEPAETRVLSAAVARAATASLVDVVASGTGRRVRDAFVAADGTPLRIGGKTGTGDNRNVIVDARGSRVASQARSRTATLVFFVENHFGVVTVYVDGPEASDYSFTSALPAQVLRYVAPTLQPLFDRAPEVPLRSPISF
jgi:membrane peptidoglycan carboxypeptidase